MVLAFRITRTFTTGHPIRLSPFTMSWALPQALGYYDDSDTLALSGLRHSRIPCATDVS